MVLTVVQISWNFRCIVILAVFKEMLGQLRVVVQTCNTCIIEIKQTNSSFFCITGIGWGHVKTEK